MGDVLGVGHLAERVDHVVGRERLPIVPRHVRPGLTPGRRVVARVPLEGEARLHLEVGADAAERIVDVEVPRGVDERGAARGVERLALAGADMSDTEAAARRRPFRPTAGRRANGRFVVVATAGGKEPPAPSARPVAAALRRSLRRVIRASKTSGPRFQDRCFDPHSTPWYVASSG